MLFVVYPLCKIPTFQNQTLNNTILWRDKQSVVKNAAMCELWVKAIADAVFKTSGNVFSIVGPINDANLNLHYAYNILMPYHIVVFQALWGNSTEFGFWRGFVFGSSVNK